MVSKSCASEVTSIWLCNLLFHCLGSVGSLDPLGSLPSSFSQAPLEAPFGGVFGATPASTSAGALLGGAVSPGSSSGTKTHLQHLVTPEESAKPYIKSNCRLRRGLRSAGGGPAGGMAPLPPSQIALVRATAQNRTWMSAPDLF